MARLAYQAPGVYVEEVPSARQPIAGVGTNTVGFIGLVGDHVWVPVPNPDYDPMNARELFELTRGGSGEARVRLTAELAELEAKVVSLAAALQQAQADEGQKTTAAGQAQTARNNLAAGDPGIGAADRALVQANRAAVAAGRAVRDASSALDRATGDRDALKAQLNPSAAAPAAAPPAGASAAEAEDLEYLDSDPPGELTRPSRFRPYYFEKREIRAGALATKLCTNYSEYTALFGEMSGFKSAPDESSLPLNPGHHLLSHAVRGFFENGGTRCFVARISKVGDLEKVLTRFESIDDVAILAAPGLPKVQDVWDPLQSYCEDDSHQNVFAILDAPGVVNDETSNDLEITRLQFDDPKTVLPRTSTHAALYFPFIEVSCPAKRLQDSDPARGVPPKYWGRTYVAPSGHLAGIYARTDEERGVHKAPANAIVRGALEVKYYVSKPKQELLNPQGVNCIRLLNGAVTVWGARTIGGEKNGEWKYVNVRRFAGFLEESIDRGTQWVVFEPNDPNLWSRIVLNVTAFLTNVWRGGALFGLTPEEAFYVKCDAELNPPEVRDLGQVITEIGVAIVRPAEFVIFRISQSTGERKS